MEFMKFIAFMEFKRVTECAKLSELTLQTQ